MAEVVHHAGKLMYLMAEKSVYVILRYLNWSQDEMHQCLEKIFKYMLLHNLIIWVVEDKTEHQGTLGTLCFQELLNLPKLCYVWEIFLVD